MKDTYKRIEDFAEEMGVEELITVDGYDEAFLGIAEGFGGTMVAVYDYNMCIQILMKNDMSYEEAVEFFQFNTLGAYHADSQPIYLHMDPTLFKPTKTTRDSHLTPRFSGTIDDCPPDAPKPDHDWLGL